MPSKWNAQFESCSRIFFGGFSLPKSQLQYLTWKFVGVTCYPWLKAPTVSQYLAWEWNSLGWDLPWHRHTRGWYWRDEHLKHLELFLIWVFMVFHVIIPEHSGLLTAGKQAYCWNVFAIPTLDLAGLISPAGLPLTSMKSDKSRCPEWTSLNVQVTVQKAGFKYGTVATPN